MKTLRTLGFLGTGWCLCLLATTAFAQQYSVSRIPSHFGGPMGVRALNSAGAVVGFTRPADNSLERGFVYQGGAVTVLETLGGNLALAEALNNHGQIAGASDTADGSRHAFVFRDGSVHDLGTLGGDSYGFAINNAGDVAGSFIGLDGMTRVFVYTNGATEMLDVGSLGGPMTIFAGMNNNGDIAGDTFTSDGAYRAFLYRNGSMLDLGTLEGGNFSSAYGLNDAGDVVGWGDTFDVTVTRAFLFRNGVMTDLGSLGGSSSIAYEVNNAGDVMGESLLPGDLGPHSFIVTNRVMVDLGDLGGGMNWPTDMNNLRQVVGYGFNEIGSQVAFLWENGQMIDLNTVLPPDSGWRLITAEYINDAGQIVGFGTFEGADAWYMLSTGNQAPTADAGLDQTVECGSAVQLSGSGSDPDGDTLTYEWRNGTTVLGNTAALSVSLPLGSHTLTLRAADPAGLNHEDTVVVTVEDTTAPVVAGPAAHTLAVDVNCSATMPDFTGSVVATDACGSSDTLTKSQTPAAGTIVGLGTHSVTVTVTDASGNSGSHTVTLQVVDLTPPTGHCSDPVTTEAGANGTAAVADFLATLAVTDNCTPASALVKTQSPVAGTLLGLGSHVVTLTVTDAAGNQSTCTTVFQVVDRTAPVLTPAAPVTVTAGANGMGGTPDVLRMCSVSDNCDRDVTLVQNPAAGTQLPIGSHTVTITATDDSGNSVSGTTRVTVNDTTAPVITSVTVNPSSIGGKNGNLVPVNVTVNATDNSGSVTSRIVSITSSQPVTSKGDKTSPDWMIDSNLGGRVRAEVASGAKMRIYTITVQSSDASGNTSTATTTVTARR